MRAHASLLLLIVAFTAALAAAPLTMDIWPGPAPGEESFRPPAANPKSAARNDGVTRISLVTEPTLTVFHPSGDTANGTAIVVCPGGGYNLLAWDKEGTEVAGWLNTLGITAIVLKYRVPRRDPREPHVAPLQDAQRALRLVRRYADSWRVNPMRVGILGFSAGGNLAVMAGTHWDRQSYPRHDAADDLSCRPDFMIPIYPAYLADEERPGPLSPLVRVGHKTPPTFMAVTDDDKLRGRNAALLYAELKSSGVPAELHVFAKGGHGYGLRPSPDPVSQWPKLCEAWLRQQGLLSR
jgi:acetyl esterase/lipase